ncbi:MAG: TonB family protein [bacterium]
MQVLYKKIKADLKQAYATNLKKSLILVLLLFIALVNISPKIPVKTENVNAPHVVLTIEDIPITRQAFRRPPPPKPQIPVPSEDESIPEDETIVETTLKYTNVFDNLPEGTIGPVGLKITPPRPIAWVFPEYPKDMKKKGIRGEVKLSIHITEKGNVSEVVVLENTTGSKACADAAVSAAYGSRFSPAREGNKPINFWITQPYRFDVSR